MSGAISFRYDRSKSGAALVIVLFFIVLLTGLMAIFLSRTLTARQASLSSTTGTKASVLAESACEIILGDLKQEIVDGSTVSTPATGYNVYTPKATTGASAGSTAVPAIVGFTPAFTSGVETDGLANLVKVSLRNQPFYSMTTNSNYAVTGISRASPVNSTSDASLNGRVITSDRWNSHYLIGRRYTGTTLDSTPTNNFPAPDWVIVTRSGASTAYTSSQVNLLNNPIGANSGTYAIGRFAYAIYNEGGLLDMNAAGYPSTLPPQLASQKGSSALADLTQLPTSLSSSTPILTQAQIDNLVGWRNAYTSQLASGQSTFGSVTFDSPSATNWFNNFASYNIGQINPNMSNNAPLGGFMRANTNHATAFYPNAGVYPNANTSAPTDQVLLSRQQLISLVDSLGISPDALQYLGTFSRSLEQPSYAPDPGRPFILSSTNLPPAQPLEAAYMGNNDQAGNDLIVNPAFLSVRVASAFTRFNGAAAVVGEPLVKYRFPLSRLAVVAYNATSSTALPGGFAKSTADPDPIYDHFGLKRASASSPWVYNHGQNYILPLGNPTNLAGLAHPYSVQDAGREPDFAELLKAAITAGALGKAAPNFQVNGSPNPVGDNFEYSIDTSVDYQVLQIMANLIDQQDADSYPTWIQIASGPGGATNIYGVEDLPYLYRETYMPVVVTAPTNLPGTIPPTGPISVTNTVTVGATVTGGTRQVKLYQRFTASTGSTATNINAYVTNTPTISSPVTLTGATLLTSATNTAPTVLAAASGSVGYVYVVQLWNPHDPNTATANTTGPAPTLMRLVALTQSPSATSVTWQLGEENNLNVPTNIITEHDGNNPPTYYYWPISKVLTRGRANSGIDFTNYPTYFREPTMLWNKFAVPSLVAEGTATDHGRLSDANTPTPTSYYGIVLGEAPMQIVCQICTVGAPGGAGSPGDGNYLLQASTVSPLAYFPTAGAYEQITFALQYQDPNNSGNWLTYDNAYTWPNQSLVPAHTIEVSTDPYYATNYGYKNVIQAQLSPPTVQFDPRTPRWGVENEVNLGEISTGTGGIPDTASPLKGKTAYLLEPLGYTNVLLNTRINNGLMENVFSVFETERPRADKGESDTLNTPGNPSGSGGALNAQMHLFSGDSYSSNAPSSNPSEFGGLMEQNNPALTFNGRDNSTVNHYYFEDADGVARRAMGAYADTTMTDSTAGTTNSLALPITTTPHRIGLPLATANTYPAANAPLALGTPTQQSQSRPIVLNRPFRSVSEMSYSFTGTPWKNIDFFTPESGYAGLLDVFCVGDPPSNGLTAGKVDLNTRQEPVLQALIAGASRDEWYNASNAPSYALPPLSTAEAKNVATSLIKYTTDLPDYWRGPLANLSSLVGRYVSPSVPSTTTTYNTTINNNLDWYTYGLTSPASGQVTYAGFTGLLDANVYTNTTNNASMVSPIIQRFRESALRPLADNGQTRVWNLLIDVIAQTGRYPSTATALSQFEVDGEKRIWLHVAIDRYTGQILDKQVEVVAQ